MTRLVHPVDAERAVWDAFDAWGRGDAATTQRVRAVVHGVGGAPDVGMASAMAAVVPPHCGGKLYATANGRFTFVNVLFDVDGRLLATADGESVTALRTPAMSSLAIHHLAASHASVAAVIGAGTQAWPHVLMLQRALHGLADLRTCWRPGSASAGDLCRRALDAGLPASVAGSPTDAVSGAHVVVTVTKSLTPPFSASAIGDDALVCAVGATKHDRAEIPANLLPRSAAIVCDDVEGSRSECGDLIQAAAAGTFDWVDAVELHAVIAGTQSVARAGAGPVPLRGAWCGPHPARRHRARLHAFPRAVIAQLIFSVFNTLDSLPR